MPSFSRRQVLLGLGTSLGVGVLAACGEDENSVTGRAQGEGEAGYISGDGSVEEVAPGDRAEPVSLTGETLTGETFDLADDDHKVVVLNTWGQWCPPCIEEMPELQALWEDYEPRDVLMLGLNQRDSLATAQAFMESRELTFPSLRDDGGGTLSGLQGSAANTPTSLVLDAQGRIAARVLGATDKATLSALVDGVLAESA